MTLFLFLRIQFINRNPFLSSICMFNSIKIFAMKDYIKSSKNFILIIYTKNEMSTENLGAKIC